MQLNQLPKVNNHFIAHIIRDTFSEKNFTVIYGSDTNLKSTLLSSEHSIGAFQLYSDFVDDSESENCQFWNIGINNPTINYGDVDLFVSINYKPTLSFVNYESAAKQIAQLLKSKGKAFIVNPGDWAIELEKFLSIDINSTTNIKRYSMFKDENVVVYENI